MRKAFAVIGQLLAYGAFMALVGYFSVAPAYTPFDPNLALLKLSFRHTGPTKVECRRRTPEEIAKLAPNMRRSLDCPRERLPVAVELELDGRRLYAASIAPSGVWKDGHSNSYVTFAVTAGRHRLTTRLRDSRRTEGFDHERSAEIELAPRQVFVVDFRADKGGFLFN
ncbi:MAG: hypothetical protein A2W18_15385 [Candidatus Muproteobacteria bacterium RBG_16_60_9]|uniref:Uncharacterized protein n=1 Tax=Candidatus Muproteobacteria bacterium RBG_16_60_9 TaxID=1817755 RepID=A0A1F6VCI5_9PROT|nr:MAG: hypothetical protein A2W18_15385 [Candidatus Muproteobacteria bacterium RBG_16_60_9]